MEGEAAHLPARRENSGPDGSTLNVPSFSSRGSSQTLILGTMTFLPDRPQIQIQSKICVALPLFRYVRFLVAEFYNLVPTQLIFVLHLSGNNYEVNQAFKHDITKAFINTAAKYSHKSYGLGSEL